MLCFHGDARGGGGGGGRKVRALVGGRRTGHPIARLLFRAVPEGLDGVSWNERAAEEASPEGASEEASPEGASSVPRAFKMTLGHRIVTRSDAR